ncbi:unnamed protein product [Anisakis simplex]|uniref:Secreted protein n=1 Tax=Anisakis simplex TaxID=6269 RepID=A0A0M3JH98_ANISI|nr:unnamed protein product [Anisakis simplex]
MKGAANGTLLCISVSIQQETRNRVHRNSYMSRFLKRGCQHPWEHKMACQDWERGQGERGCETEYDEMR